MATVSFHANFYVLLLFFSADVRVATNIFGDLAKKNMVALEMYHPILLQERTCISTVGSVVRR